MIDKLNKKQNFINLTIIGGIIIVGAFIWSMIINFNQISISNPIPEVDMPEFSELTDDIDTGNESNTTELQEITEILEQESGQNQDSQTDIDTKDIKLDLEQNQE